MPGAAIRQNSKRIRQTCIVYLIIFQNLSVKAQLNESDTTAFQVRATLSGLRQKGNVDLAMVRTRIEALAALNPSLTFKTQNNTLYQEFGERKADNDLHSRNFLYLKPGETWYPFAMTFVQSNFRQKIDLRYFGGAGLTWQVIRLADHQLKLSAAFVYELSRFSTSVFNTAAYNGRYEIEIWRPTAYLSGNHKIAGTPIRIFYSGYWQVGLGKVSNQRIWTETGLEFFLWKGLNLNLQYTWIYDEVVVLRVKQQDAIFSVGAAFQFKKLQKRNP